MPDSNELKEESELKKAWEKALKEAEVERQRKIILRRFLDDASYERMMNIRASNKKLYLQLAKLIISLVQSNRITSKIPEEQFLRLLKKLTYKPEPKIIFKHK